MKKMFLLCSLVIPLAVTAECQFDNKVIGASYRVTNSAHSELTHSELNQLESPVLHRIVNFWRDDREVAYEYVDRKMTRKWNQVTNKLIRPVVYFDQYLRGIEYPPQAPDQDRTNQNWQSKYQIIPPGLIEDLTETKKEGPECHIEITYQKSISDPDSKSSVDLVWLPEYELPKMFSQKTSINTVTWELISLELYSAKVKNFFQTKRDFTLTDFADIGDNESDPFLSKMVNLGFIDHGLQESPTKRTNPKHFRSHSKPQSDQDEHIH